MKPANLFIASIVILLAITAYFLLSPSADSIDNGDRKSIKSTELFTKEIVQIRKDKDVFFRTNEASPLTDKAKFAGITYFPPSIDYRVEARFEPFADKTQRLTIPLSDGSEEVYEKAGTAVFKLQGEVCRLLIVKHDDTYSILFRDATTGKTTYGGGRYIDLDEKNFDGNQVTIDFNAAYHPFCVYNHNYACPLPPAENTLPVAVEAGEKLPADYVAP